jgi:hypothetical protein
MFLPPTDDVVLELRAVQWQSSVILEGDTTRALIVVARFLVGLSVGGGEPICRLAKSGRDQHSSASPPTSRAVSYTSHHGRFPGVSFASAIAFDCRTCPSTVESLVAQRLYFPAISSMCKTSPIRGVIEV